MAQTSRTGEQAGGTSRTYVVCEAKRVVGNYALASGATAHAADAIGIRGIVVHAISKEARQFYITLGFDPCPAEAMTLVVTLRDVRATLEPG